MTGATIKFNHDGIPEEFDIAHNLDEYGLDIEAALVNWVHRTNDFSQESFMRYVVSKDVNLICVSREEFDKVMEKIKSEEERKLHWRHRWNKNNV